MTLDWLKQYLLDTVKRYEFIGPGEIETAFGIAATTVCNDKRKGLIKPNDPNAKYPEFSLAEVHAYLIRKKPYIQNKFSGEAVIAARQQASPHSN